MKPADSLFVSCVLGRQFSRLHPAFRGFRCVMFSNNPTIEMEARRQGWEFVLVTVFPLNDDIHESSLQAKYIKFLQFLSDYPEYRNYRSILYADHKMYLSLRELERLCNLVEPDTDVFMMSSLEGWSVLDEISRTSFQERYRLAVPETKIWIQKQVDSGRAEWQGQIYATGFIIYNNVEALHPFLKEQYETLWELRQPHCQTIWAVLCQAHGVKIQSIHWTETSMVSHTPLPFSQHLKRRVRHGARKCVKPVFELFGVDYEKWRKDVLLKILPPSIK